MTQENRIFLQPNQTASKLKTGLVGRSILASGSPFLHEQEARAHGLALTYELLDFTQRNWADDDLPAVLSELAANGFAGCNITFPFKQAVIPLLDRIEESAQLVGAVNTVVFRDGRMIGFNTDMEGFRDSFQKQMHDEARDRVLLLGAGGAGAAVATALLLEGVRELVVVDADVARAQVLAERLANGFPEASVRIADGRSVETGAVDGIVNATPVGMASHPGMPLPPELVSSDHWVADIIYFPRETQLLALARTKGCRIMNGVGMVVGQAARAFTLMTGYSADYARMAKSADLIGD